MRKFDTLSVIIILSLVTLDAFVWYHIALSGPPLSPAFNFLDVGQGDAELLILPGGIKVMTDAGPSAKVVRSLERALAAGDRYVDVAVISHPQLDHFEGFNYLLDRFRFGVFIVNGRSDPGVPEWDALVKKIQDKRIPIVTLGEGDRIIYGENQIGILSPNQDWLQSGELNDTGLVEFIKTPSFDALLTADIGFNVEEYLIRKFSLRADILKVGHHGSKYSSGGKFLAAVAPKIAVIEVGVKNTYGHPTKEALERLAASGAKVFRTDQNGNVRVLAEGGKLRVFVEKQ